MKSQSSYTIGVFASSSPNLSSQYYEMGYKLGESLASSGYALIYGGGNNGLMGPLAMGFKKKGGFLIGVIPKSLKEAGYCYQNADQIIVTENLSQRKLIINAQADAFLILPGGIGTFDELFTVLAEKQLGFHQKPIILVEIDGFFSPFLNYLSELQGKGFFSQYKNLFRIANSTDEALAILAKAFLIRNYISG